VHIFPLAHVQLAGELGGTRLPHGPGAPLSPIDAAHIPLVIAHTFALWPLDVIAETHERSALHSFPFGQAGVQ
jgi:hypothetical protein